MMDDELGVGSLDSDSTNPKELFELDDIEGKTELTSEQVVIISRLKILSSLYKDKYKINYIDELITHFLRLQVSKDRMSRQEFVSSMQSKNDVNNQGLMDKLSFNTSLK